MKLNNKLLYYHNDRIIRRLETNNLSISYSIDDNGNISYEFEGIKNNIKVDNKKDNNGQLINTMKVRELLISKDINTHIHEEEKIA